MLELRNDSLKNPAPWTAAGIAMPQFDREAMIRRTGESPQWIHFGAGNIFRGFVAVLQQELLDRKLTETGIVAAETFDYAIIDRIYKPYDNLSLVVTMRADGRFENRVVASLAEGLVADPSRADDWARLQKYFTKPSLQMASFTITEKGYSLNKLSGEVLPDVQEDFKNGPAKPKTPMAKVAALAYHRYRNGKHPLAFVSMDNCSHNGEKLGTAVKTIVQKWTENGLVDKGFLAWISDPAKVSFPWSMIDKITPRPDASVKEALTKIGFGSTEIVVTDKNTYIAPFVNAEGPQYLVIENAFPNGRPPLEKAGVYFAERKVVDQVEKMKVCTCLNPLHTSLAVYGCLLGYTSIAAEMKNESLRKLVEKIGYDEGLPVVVNPGIIDPKRFIKEVLEERLPNPYMPDTPQRIASDTSMKVGIRFGETIKAYKAEKGLDPSKLKFIPLVIAGWCRYLLGIDDGGKEFKVSPDPMLSDLQALLAGVKLGDPKSAAGKLKPILSNKQVFGVDLYEVKLGHVVEGYFEELLAGPGAVAATLKKYVK